MDVVNLLLLLFALVLVGSLVYIALRAAGVVGTTDDPEFDENGVALTEEEKKKKVLDDAKAEAEEKARDSNEFSKFIGTNKALILTTGAAALIVKNIAQKVSKRKIAKKVAANTAQTALSRIGSKGGAKALVRTGSVTLNKAAKVHGAIVAKKVGTEAGKQAGEAAGKLAAKQFLAKMSKFFVVLGKGLVRFDLVSFSLDIADLFIGGAGYAHMGTKQSYYAMQGEIYRGVEAAYKEAGEIFPAIVGPFDKMNPITLQKSLQGRVTVYMNQPDNKYTQMVIDELKKQQFNNGAEVVKSIDQIIDEVYTDQTYKDIETYITNQICVDNGGKVVDGDKCSYKDKNQCINSYSWPLQDDDIYAEWKDGKCVMASSEMRKYCTAQGLGYNIDTGICDVNKAYCNNNEANYQPNPKLCDYHPPYLNAKSYYTGPKKSGGILSFFDDISERASKKPEPVAGCTPERDCMLSDAQFWTDLVFGTTVSRGAREVGREVVNIFEDGEVSEGQHDGWLRVKDRLTGETNKQWLDRITNEIVDPRKFPDSTQKATTDSEMEKRGDLWPLEKVNGKVRFRESPENISKSKYLNPFYSPGTGPN